MLVCVGNILSLSRNSKLFHRWHYFDCCYKKTVCHPSAYNYVQWPNTVEVRQRNLATQWPGPCSQSRDVGGHILSPAYCLVARHCVLKCAAVRQASTSNIWLQFERDIFHPSFGNYVYVKLWICRFDSQSVGYYYISVKKNFFSLFTS